VSIINPKMIVPNVMDLIHNYNILNIISQLIAYLQNPVTGRRHSCFTNVPYACRWIHLLLFMKYGFFKMADGVYV